MKNLEIYYLSIQIERINKQIVVGIAVDCLGKRRKSHGTHSTNG